MATPTLKKFLSQINGILDAGDGPKLREYLVLEPPFAQAYQEIIAELKQSYPDSKESGQAGTIKKLEQLIQSYIPHDDPATHEPRSSQSFTSFLALYLVFIRDAADQDFATTFESLRDVLRSLSSVLGNNTVGPLMYETAIFYCQTLVRFTRNLLTAPHLTATLVAEWNARVEEPVSLASLAVGSIRPIFEKCAPYPPTKANTGLDDAGRPAGARAGTYTIANLCFPLCLKTGRMEVLEGIIQQIDSKGLSLYHYPVAQRVTYLYYLGRFWFSYNHFHRASVVLNEAYMHTPARFQCQRTQILTYLLASNIILGRFPSRQLLSRPEAESIGPHFFRLCTIIRKGDLSRFRSVLDVTSRDVFDRTAAKFFFRKKVLYQFQNRCLVLVQRSFFRRIFIISGFHPDATTKAAPNFDLTIARDIIVQLEKRAAMLSPAAAYALSDAIDPDFDDDEDLYAEYGFEEEDADRVETDEEADGERPSLADVEGFAASLIYQDLIHGNISHRLAKVVITGAKGKNPIEVGFPPVCSVTNRGDDGKNIPGWKRSDI